MYEVSLFTTIAILCLCYSLICLFKDNAFSRCKINVERPEYEIALKMKIFKFDMCNINNIYS